MSGWRLEHSYAALPPNFFSKAAPTPVREPGLVIFNRPLAASLGLDADVLETPDGAAIFAGNALPEGAMPIAQAYAGHQFGHFTMLGDGRAILLGEQITPTGARFDIQLKGPGQTRYSRRGDGRAAVGPMLREYIISEAMHALGIPTTRSLAVASTGEPVYRETMLPGAVLTRVAASHIRVGTMQWAAAFGGNAAALGGNAAALGGNGATRVLADYTIARHYPHLADAPGRHLALFAAIVDRQASLIAKWQLVGFIHGVMNTDNMALSCETIDYGPCAFMDRYDPETVFSSIDHGGRYAYGSQPPIAQWNLARLAEAMLPLFDENGDRGVELATPILEGFQALFEQRWLAGMRAKLGLFAPVEGDEALVGDLLEWMRAHHADFTNTFAALAASRDLDEALAADGSWHAWRQRWDARRRAQLQPVEESSVLMRKSNPAVIPRNHKVEEALAAATGEGDVAVAERLLAVLANPYNHEQAESEFVLAAPSSPQPYRTFCGT